MPPGHELCFCRHTLVSGALSGVNDAGTPVGDVAKGMYFPRYLLSSEAHLMCSLMPFDVNGNPPKQRMLCRREYIWHA